MKRIRSISPFITVLLMVLVLAGSFGYTLIHYTCFHCGTEEVVASVTVSPDEQRCCCRHDSGIMHHSHSFGEMALSDDCCSHQAKRIVTDELVRSEFQKGIFPFYLAATVIAVIQNDAPTSPRLRFNDSPPDHCRDLIKLHCQIIS